MKTPLDTRGSRVNDGRLTRLAKKQPDGTHAQRIAHLTGARLPGPGLPHRRYRAAALTRLSGDIGGQAD